jgi:anhydro-N-acetylmuramic acid kinase
MRILAVMTGTSCDGLDAACADFSLRGWKSLWTKSAPYPRTVRQRVLAAQLPKSKLSLREWGELHRDLGIWIAGALQKILVETPSNLRPQAIASHGQTVAHFPAANKKGFTIQLADPSRIAEVTGLTVISNFRDGDMAAGGEGAPLAPRFHKFIAGSRTGISIHNLGGISNLTYLGPKNLILAFDTGPANLWIDAAAELVTRGRQKFDRNGVLARAGTAKLQLGANIAIEKILRNKFFHRPPPKSTGRDGFPFQKLLQTTRARDASLIAIATRITVKSIAGAYENFILKKNLPLHTIYFTGGGAKNSFLLESLERRLPKIRIAPLTELGVDPHYLEANAFAYFGYLALQGHALGGPWTGVPVWAPPAHITPGRNWRQIVRQLARGAA